MKNLLIAVAVLALFALGMFAAGEWFDFEMGWRCGDFFPGT